ncbi:MAG: hypothetical protein Q8936_03535 [Bacillota bacterium]|nr:hypothetical protein [Bacillota bacterium]
MNNKYISLLWPENEQSYASRSMKLNDAAIDSLDIDGFCERLLGKTDEYNYIRSILTNLCYDERVIAYRQDVFMDISSSENLISSLENILGRLESLNLMDKEGSLLQETNLWSLFSRYKELDSYVESIIVIKENLKDQQIKSEGLSQLKKLIENISEDKEFKQLSKSINELTIDIDEIKSITFGINLDTALNPVEAAIVSVNKTSFKENSLFKNFLDSNGFGMSIKGVSKIHSLGSDPRHPIMYHLYRDIESLLKPVVKDLLKALKRFTHINVSFLTSLIPELTFYLKGAELYNFLKENRMPVCIPRILSVTDRKSEIKDIYNANLVIQLLKKNVDTSKEIVLNDVNFDDEGRVFILTGPNRGGKTVYTEAIGFAQILFQSGLFVPAAEAIMSPVDSIYSHFPVDENQTVNLGRLGEESKRLAEIFAEASSYSLILLNESLASTSLTEGFYIALDVVKSLRYLGARVLFNTHMHDLAKEVDTINNEVEGTSKVVSLVTGMEDGKRSYKIYPGEPLGKSYASDIAERYGVSFEQIIRNIDLKKAAVQLNTANA